MREAEAEVGSHIEAEGEDADVVIALAAVDTAAAVETEDVALEDAAVDMAAEAAAADMEEGMEAEEVATEVATEEEEAAVMADMDVAVDSDPAGGAMRTTTVTISRITKTPTSFRAEMEGMTGATGWRRCGHKPRNR